MSGWWKLVATIACLCMITTVVSSLTVGAAASEYLLTQHTDKYKTQGRVLLTSECLMVDWTASGIEFEANCEGDVYVNFQVNQVSSGEKNGCYFTVIVDGVTQSRSRCYISSAGDQYIKIASGLQSGKHTFAIYRQTEVRGGITIGIRSIRLSGELLAAPAKNELYVEFIGDSITTAYGNLTTLGNGSGEALYQDGTKGYAYLTAKQLGADYSVVAIEGIGASTGWQNFTMQEVYPKLRYTKDRNTDYDFARRPNVVVLALGTNDINRYSANGKTLDDVKQGFANMLSLVRTKNPGSKVVWIYGMMVGGADSLIREVISEAGGENAGLYTLEMTRDTSGGNGHPAEWAHRENATKLATFIRNLVSPQTTTTTKKTTTTKVTTTTTTTTTKATTTKSTTTTATTTSKTTTTGKTTASTTTTANGGGVLNPIHTLPPLPGTTTASNETVGTLPTEGTTALEADTETTTEVSDETTMPTSTAVSSATTAKATTKPVAGTPEDKGGNKGILWGAVAAAAVAIGGTAFAIVKRKK